MDCCGQSLPTDSPESVGMLSERLKRIAPAIQQRVDEVTLPEASALIARKGRVAYFEQFGYADVEAKRPIQPDTIVRLDSQPKSITGVAVITPGVTHSHQHVRTSMRLRR